MHMRSSAWGFRVLLLARQAPAAYARQASQPREFERSSGLALARLLCWRFQFVLTIPHLSFPKSSFKRPLVHMPTHGDHSCHLKRGFGNDGFKGESAMRAYCAFGWASVDSSFVFVVGVSRTSAVHLRRIS